MRNLLNPRWLFIINTLPIAVLFVLFFGQFHIIHTLLEEDRLRLWKIFGCILGMMGLLNFIYAAYLTFKKQPVSIAYSIVALLAYITFLYIYGFHSEEMIPFNVPQWMISGNIFLYAGTFLMPTLIYSLFILVVCWTSEDKEHKAWVNFLIAIAVPLVAYLFFQVILPLWRPLSDNFGIHGFLILVITGTLVFIFFLVRGIYIFASRKTVAWRQYQLLWKIPIALLFPLLGLFINNKDAINYGFHSGIFGNFNSLWFYILAALNGILICLPNLPNKLYRLLLFIGRSIMFAYTFYFFLVFLPFLPLSVIAIIAIGTGVLMLTPLALFVTHVHELSKDFAWLKTFFSGKLLAGIVVAGFLVIPVVITATYLHDRLVLNEALDYVYSPDYSKKYPVIHTKSLQRTLDMIEQHKEKNNDWLSSRQIPYLSTYFNRLVLDNLTLSDSKIYYLQEIFLGKELFNLYDDVIRDDKVKITDISTGSVYDEMQQAWKTWVDLEITNHNDSGWAAEYTTTLNLPDGCWISDYYLYVGDRKEYGILAEKKAAKWVFSQIRNENRDPGILYYQTGNKVTFRVFPFQANEVRKTGIEFLHKEPLYIQMDDENILLGNWKTPFSGSVETENVAYISIKQKNDLERVQRQPYFHFLVDVSKGKDSCVTDFTRRIENLLASRKPYAENAQISFVNSYVNTCPASGNWKQHYQSQKFEGGFYLDRAIRMTLFNAYKNNQMYPVIVVVTDDFDRNAILDKDFSDMEFIFPESDMYYYLDKDETWQVHSLLGSAGAEFEDIHQYQPFDDRAVLEYKLSGNSIAYIPNDYNPSIVLKKELFPSNETEIKERDWQSALTMQGKWMSQVLHPETTNKEWLNLVKYSFLSKVMTPVTSYLVVENEAQKAILEKKQAQVLAGNPSLDPDEDSFRMSEPGVWIVALLLVLIVWYKNTRQQRQS